MRHTAEKLQAKFSLIDDFSKKLDVITKAGDACVRKFDTIATSADKAMNKVATGLNKASDKMSQTVSSAADMSAATDNVTDSIGQTAEASDVLAKKLDELIELQKQNSESSAVLQSDYDSLKEKLEQAEKTIDELSEKIEKLTEESEKAPKGFEALGNVIQALGLAKVAQEISAALLDCSQSAAEFETSVAKVSTLVDTNKVSMRSMRDELLQLSGDTGKSVNDLSDATYQAISASVEVGNAIATVDKANKLAVGGFTSSATAVDVLTTALNAYNLSADQTEYISDILVTTQNLGKTTVDELASSVGKTIPLAAAYNVEMDNLSTAYAQLTKNGIATAEAGTYIKSMLNELGDSSSNVAKVLKDETGNTFAELSSEGKSIGDVLDVLVDSVNGNLTKFNELWGSVEAGTGALSLAKAGSDAYNDTLMAMKDSAGATELAYSKMMDTTEAASQKFSNSAQNVAIAIGDDLNPCLEAMYNAGSNVLNIFASWIDQCPALSGAIAGLAVALGAMGLAGAIAGIVKLVPKIAEMLSLSPKIMIIVAAIAGAVAVITALTVALSNTNKEYESWTASTKVNYDELQKANAEYKNACEEFGATSAEASALKNKVDSLTESFENNKMTIEELYDRFDKHIELSQQITSSYQDNNFEIENQYETAGNLVNKLEELATSSEKTAASQEQMKQIVSTLNGMYPELGLNVESVIDNIDALGDKIMKTAEKTYKKRKVENAQNSIADLMGQEETLRRDIEIAEANMLAAGKKYSQQNIFEGTATTLLNSGATKEYNDAKAKWEALHDQLTANIQAQEDAKQTIEDYAKEAEEAANATLSYGEACERAVDGSKDAIQELCDKYDEAYDAARKSIDSQIGLFDTMATESKIKVEDMFDAFTSQYEYLTTYSENLKKAASLGLDDDLIAKLSDGSAESAGYLNEIVTQAENLDSDGAKKFVSEFNDAFKKTEQAKDTFSHTVAGMQTDFDKEVDKVKESLENAVNDMNMSDESRKAALETMDAYIEAIKSKQAEAVSASEAVAYATANVLNGKAQYPTGYVPGMPSDVYEKIQHNANGTDNAANAFIAGEEGPELVVGAGGSKVFTADETQSIFRNAAAALGAAQSSALPYASQERKIVIDFGGKGSIKVDGNANVDDIVAVMYEYAKPILVSLLEEEMVEEGEESHEF